MSSDQSNPSGILLAFLLGGIAGAAVAVLFAPHSGSETRDRLGERLREGAERGRELRERAVSSAREVVDDAQEVVQRRRETAVRAKDRLAAAIEAGREAYREEKGRSRTAES